VKKDMLTFSRVDSFGPHSVYYHGCLKDFLDITKWQGSEVLYFGDHLYSDLRGPAKAGWGTVAIIRELEVNLSFQTHSKLGYLILFFLFGPVYCGVEFLFSKNIFSFVDWFSQREIMTQNEGEYRFEQVSHCQSCTFVYFPAISVRTEDGLSVPYIC
jgi:hypothetical protein